MYVDTCVHNFQCLYARRGTPHACSAYMCIKHDDTPSPLVLGDPTYVCIANCATQSDIKTNGTLHALIYSHVYTITYTLNIAYTSVLTCMLTSVLTSVLTSMLTFVQALELL